jgi:hypothetical protein
MRSMIKNCLKRSAKVEFTWGQELLMYSSALQKQPLGITLMLRIIRTWIVLRTHNLTKKKRLFLS